MTVAEVLYILRWAVVMAAVLVVILQLRMLASDGGLVLRNAGLVACLVSGASAAIEAVHIGAWCYAPGRVLDGADQFSGATLTYMRHFVGGWSFLMTVFAGWVSACGCLLARPLSRTSARVGFGVSAAMSVLFGCASSVLIFDARRVMDDELAELWRATGSWDLGARTVACVLVTAGWLALSRVA